MMIALVGLNANAAMYIVGSGIFGNWNPGGGVEMTNNGDGTYSYTTTVDGEVFFVFGDGLNSDWGVFNSNHRYGPATGDMTISAGNWITTQKAGDHGAYAFSGNGGEYVFTFDETNHRFKVEGSVLPFNPLTGKLFILGQVNGNNWNPSTGIEMDPLDVTVNDIFVLDDVIVSDSGDGYGYFSFTTKLGKNADDWSFLPYRRGAVEDGVLVEDGRKASLGDWGTANAFKILPGTYDFTVSIKEGQNAYVKADKKADPIPVVDDVFIIGDVNNFSTAEGWDPTKGAQMTLADSVYTATVNAVVRDGQEYAYFGFTKKIAEPESETPWDDIEAFRFGPVSEGDFVMTQELLGTQCALATDGSYASIAIPAGEWTVTVNLENNTFSINGEWPVDTIVPEPTVDVFIIGDVNNFSTAEGWDPTKGAQMTLADSVYTATVNAVVRDGQEYAYFGFTKKIAEPESETPWDDIEAFRFGPVSEGDFVMTQELLGTQCALATDGSYASIAIPAGEWTVTVNLENNTFSINGEWPVDTIVPEPYTGDVYILGEVNDNGGWFPNVGVQMTRDAQNNVFTATITTAGENDGYSYFSFTKQLAENDWENGGWDEIAGYRFGASVNDFEVTEALLGEQLQLIAQDNAFKIPAGQWNLTLSVDNMTLVIEAANGLRGDVNLSKDVTIADVTALIDYLLSGDATGISLANADCNLSKDVTIADVTALIDFLLSGNWPVVE